MSSEGTVQCKPGCEHCKQQDAMTRSASDRCAKLGCRGSRASFCHQVGPLFDHTFVEPALSVTAPQGARVVSWKVELEPEGPPVTSTKETGDAVVREMALRVALDYGVPLDHAVGILKLGCAAGRAKAFEEAEGIARERACSVVTCAGDGCDRARLVADAIAARVKETL